MDVEQMATSFMQSQLARCPHLQARIDSNDKTPLTDGHIDVYSGEGRSNADLLDRMPVQVKGRSVGRSGRFTPTFSMNRTTLNAYKRQGSVLFFVVFVEPDGTSHPFYYNLSPFKVDLLLRDLPAKRSSASLQLAELPEDVAGVEKIVNHALLTRRQRYASFEGAGLEGVTELTVRSLEALDFNTPTLISPLVGDYEMEVQTATGTTLSLPGELMVYPASYMEHSVDVEVSAGGATFTAPTARQLGDEHHEVKLSDGLVLTLQMAEGTQTSNISLTLPGPVADRAQHIDFFLGLIDDGQLTLNGQPQRFEIPKTSDYADLRRHRSYLGRLIELLGILDVDPNLITFDDITDEQHRQLAYIYGSLIHGRELRAQNGTVGSVLESIGTWRLMLLVLPGSGPGLWRYVDPFHPDNRFQYRAYRVEDNEPARPATAYEGIDTEILHTVLNLHLRHIVGAYKIIDDLPDTRLLANWRVLYLIEAADASTERRADFLDGAHTLNEWLLEEEPDRDIHLINRSQILARTSELDQTQKQQIRQMRRDAIAAGGGLQDRFLEASASILLKEWDELDNSLQNLAENDLKTFQTWPIWALRTRHSATVSEERPS